MLVNSYTKKIRSRRAKIGWKVLRVRRIGDETALTSVFSKGRFVQNALTTHQHNEGITLFGTLEEAIEWAKEIAGQKKNGKSFFGDDLLQIHRVRFSEFPNSESDEDLIVDYRACRNAGGTSKVREVRTKFWDLVRKGENLDEIGEFLKDAPEGLRFARAVRVLAPVITVTCSSFVK